MRESKWDRFIHDQLDDDCELCEQENEEEAKK